MLDATINSFDLRRGTAVGAATIAALATIFPDEKFSIDSFDDPRDLLDRPSSAGRSLDVPEPEEPEHQPVEPGSYQRRHHPVDARGNHDGTRSGPGSAPCRRLRRSCAHRRLRLDRG
ncbi:hypothetical protein [Devosia marina]|uniref:hypothetical protein n=1 Tax=Devosia marina TaxID=2683198 RepID=UPI0015D247B9|nr:hypothetical protein [Devosia marina]